MTWVGLDWLITGFSSMFTQNPDPVATIAMCGSTAAEGMST